MIETTANLSLEIKDSLGKWNVFKVLIENKSLSTLNFTFSENILQNWR